MTAIASTTTSPWLITYRAYDGGRARMRLFCFHYAGATASIFRGWPAALPEAVETVAVQLPGREYRLAEPLLTDIGPIVSALGEVIAPLLDRPFAFFGHSMGALLGFDLIRLLRARGLPQPDLLIASGRNAPEFKWRDAGVQALPDDEFLATVRDYNGTPPALLAEASLRELWLPRLRADLTISARYEYAEGRPLDCPILVMSGEGDGLVTDAGLSGWRAHTTGEVRYVRYPGHHFFLHSAEPLVLAHLRDELENRLARVKENGDDDSWPRHGSG